MTKDLSCRHSRTRNAVLRHPGLPNGYTYMPMADAWADRWAIRTHPLGPPAGAADAAGDMADTMAVPREAW